jgi:hypothetical protein
VLHSPGQGSIANPIFFFPERIPAEKGRIIVNNQGDTVEIGLIKGVE